MEANKKAKELFNYYWSLLPITIENDVELAKQFSLKSVDEIIESEKLDYLFSKEEINSMEFTSDSMWIYERFTKYWQEVKEEIKQL